MQRLMLILIAALAAARPAMAQAPTDTVSLTVEQAVQRALDRGTDMRIAHANVVQANGQVREAMSSALPQITGSVTYTRQFASIYSGLAGGGDSTIDFSKTPFGAANQWNFQLQATQLLWSGGKVGAALGAAKAYREVANLGASETSADITFRVKQAYWNAALGARLVAIAVDNLQQARQHLHEVQLYREAGTRAEYDLLRAQVDAANQEPMVVAAQNGYDIALLELRRLVDLGAEQPLVLTTRIVSPEATISVPMTDSLAGPSRAGVQAAEATVREQEQLVRVARADRWPTLSVSTIYNEQGFPTQALPWSADYLRGWNAEVKLSIPIFQGFRTNGSIQQAKAALLRAQAQRDQVRKQVDIEVAQARAEVARAQALLAARRITVRQAERAQYLVNVRYTNGMSTQLDVSDARVAASQAEVNEVQAFRDYVVAIAQLERALGRPVPVVERPIDQVAQISNGKGIQP
jgi:outer membrane protein TolC